VILFDYMHHCICSTDGQKRWH